MTTLTGRTAPAATIQTVAEISPPIDPNRTLSTLLTVDVVLLGLAVAMVLSFLAWVLRRRRDPLGNTPLRPNRVREDSLALAAMAYMLAVVLLSGLMSLIHGAEASLISTLGIGIGAQLAGTAACLAIASKRFDGGVSQFLWGRPGDDRRLWAPMIVALAVVGIGLCPAVSELTMRCIQLVAPQFSFPLHPTIQALRDDEQPMIVVLTLWSGAVVIAPIAEELFFRGLLQTAMLNVTRNRWSAIAIASALFALVHYRQPHAVAALMALSVLLGFAYERTGSLLPPILIHAAFNAKTLIWEALGAFPT